MSSSSGTMDIQQTGCRNHTDQRSRLLAPNAPDSASQADSSSHGTVSALLQVLHHATVSPTTARQRRAAATLAQLLKTTSSNSQGGLRHRLSLLSSAERGQLVAKLHAFQKQMFNRLAPSHSSSSFLPSPQCSLNVTSSASGDQAGSRHVHNRPQPTVGATTLTPSSDTAVSAGSAASFSFSDRHSFNASPPHLELAPSAQSSALYTDNLAFTPRGTSLFEGRFSHPEDFSVSSNASAHRSSQDDTYSSTVRSVSFPLTPRFSTQHASSDTRQSSPVTTHLPGSSSEPNQRKSPTLPSAALEQLASFLLAQHRHGATTSHTKTTFSATDQAHPAPVPTSKSEPLDSDMPRHTQPSDTQEPVSQTAPFSPGFLVSRTLASVADSQASAQSHLLRSSWDDLSNPVEATAERRRMLVSQYPNCVEALIWRTRTVCTPAFVSPELPIWDGSRFIQPIKKESASVEDDRWGSTSIRCWWRKKNFSDTIHSDLHTLIDDIPLEETEPTTMPSSEPREWALCRKPDSVDRMLQEVLRGKWHVSSDLMQPVPETLLTFCATIASQARATNSFPQIGRTSPSLVPSADDVIAVRDHGHPQTGYSFRSRRHHDSQSACLDAGDDCFGYRQETIKRARRTTGGSSLPTTNVSHGGNVTVSAGSSMPSCAAAPRSDNPYASSQTARHRTWNYSRRDARHLGAHLTTVIGSRTSSSAHMMSSSSSCNTPPSPPTSGNDTNSNTLSSQLMSPRNEEAGRRAGRAVDDLSRRGTRNAAASSYDEFRGHSHGQSVAPPVGCESDFDLIKRKTGWHPYVWYLMCRRPELYTIGIRARMVARVAGWEWEDIQKTPDVLQQFLQSICEFLEQNPVPRCMDKREAKEYKHLAANSVRTPWYLVETQAVQRALREMENAATHTPATGGLTPLLEESDDPSAASDTVSSMGRETPVLDNATPAPQHPSAEESHSGEPLAGWRLTQMNDQGGNLLGIEAAGRLLQQAASQNTGSVNRDRAEIYQQVARFATPLLNTGAAPLLRSCGVQPGSQPGYMEPQRSVEISNDVMHNDAASDQAVRCDGASNVVSSSGSSCLRPYTDQNCVENPIAFGHCGASKFATPSNIRIVPEVLKSSLPASNVPSMKDVPSRYSAPSCESQPFSLMETPLRQEASIRLLSQGSQSASPVANLVLTGAGTPPPACSVEVERSRSGPESVGECVLPSATLSRVPFSVDLASSFRLAKKQQLKDIFLPESGVQTSPSQAPLQQQVSPFGMHVSQNSCPVITVGSPPTTDVHQGLTSSSGLPLPLQMASHCGSSKE